MALRMAALRVALQHSACFSVAHLGGVSGGRRIRPTPHVGMRLVVPAADLHVRHVLRGLHILRRHRARAHVLAAAATFTAAARVDTGL